MSEHLHHHDEESEAIEKTGSCGCGHEHEHHHHDHEEECGCGCGHEHEHHEHEEPSSHAVSGTARNYIVENMDCANCAAKVERKLNALPEIGKATLTYATKKLRIVADDPEKALEAAKKCISEAEPEWELIVPQATGSAKTYIVEHMDCANCAAKLEAKINALPSVEEAILTYSTKKLQVRSASPERALAEIKACIAENEPEWELIVPESSSVKASAPVKAEQKHFDLPVILIGIAALVAVEVLERMGVSDLTLFLICLVGYLVVGGKVLMTAFRNLTRGEVFDENFLMSIATLGAFGVKEFPEALGVMLFYRIGEYFEDKAVAQSRSNIMDALDLRPEVVTLLSGGSELVIPAEEAQVGDLIQVRPGDRIPLDGVVVNGESQIDTSAVTGEPVPVSVHPGEAVISGCVNNTGLLTVRVKAVLAESMVSRIMDSVENAAASKPQIDRFITRFAKIYTPVVVACALAVAILPSILTGEWAYWVKTACTFLVISCPCALVLSVPLAFFAGIGAASKEKILFKGGNSMEALNKIKAVVMDKTGTITEGSFTVRKLEPAQGVEEETLLRAAASCEAHSTHPIARSVLAAADGLPRVELHNVEEIAGKGISAEGWLCGSRSLLEENGVTIPALGSAAGSTQVYVAKNGQYFGRILIADTVKKGAQDAVTQLHAMGLSTVMLTGDGEESAKAVAAEVGIQQVRAKLMPQDKLAAVQTLRQSEGGVLFVGDGINDAPVLAGADVGGAMGSGADAAIEAADLVFMTGEPNAIPKAIRIAKKATAISWQNVVFALLFKALVLVLGLLHYANMWFAVFADTGVAMICIANSIRILYSKH